jgi:hypothetical protein
VVDERQLRAVVPCGLVTVRAQQLDVLHRDVVRAMIADLDVDLDRSDPRGRPTDSWRAWVRLSTISIPGSARITAGRRAADRAQGNCRVACSSAAS